MKYVLYIVRNNGLCPNVYEGHYFDNYGKGFDLEEAERIRIEMKNADDRIKWIQIHEMKREV